MILLKSWVSIIFLEHKAMQVILILVSYGKVIYPVCSAVILKIYEYKTSRRRTMLILISRDWQT